MGTTPGGIFYPDDASLIRDLRDHLQQMAESIESSLGGAAARMRRHGTQSLANNASTAILWDTTTFVRGGAIATSAGIQVPREGLYSVTAQVAVANSGTTGIGHVVVQGATSGTPVLARGPFGANAPTIFGGSTLVSADAGSIITLSCFHNNGAARDVFGGTAYETALTVRWAGEAS